MFPKNASKIRFLMSYGGATGLFLLVSTFRENDFSKKKFFFPKNHVFRGFRVFFRAFREVFWAWEAIGDDWGRFRTI